MKRGALVLAVLVTLAPAAKAHTFLPAVVEIHLAETGEHELRLRPPQLPPGDERRFEPRAPGPCAVRATGDTWRVRCDAATLLGKPMSLALVAGDPRLPAPEVFLDVRWPDGRRELGVLGAGAGPGSDGPASAATSTVLLGATHILGGLDHLLFVIGLCALGGGWRRLVATVTAFTAGHSLTLAAVALDVMRPAQAPLEILVALTLLFLGRTLVAGDGERATGPRLAFVFGLVHGGAFAGALADLGLSSGRTVLPLLGFNLGVELGQLAVVLAVVGLAASARRLAPRLPPVTGRRLAGYALGVVATVLVLQRVPLLGSG